jgi:uncharacterized protein with von Willebrand factor type A (vWA) domain
MGDSNMKPDQEAHRSETAGKQAKLPQGGIVQTYQKFDPRRFPSPTQPPTDLVSPAFEHWLAYGSRHELTEEELARAIRLDPSQIAGLGPSVDALLAMLRERKEKILQTYETESVQRAAEREMERAVASAQVPRRYREPFDQAVRRAQIYQLERLWYAVGDDRSPFARQLLQVMERLGERYEIDELAARYDFRGRTEMTVPQALAVKEELERIDELIRQLEEARRTAQIGIVDLEALAEFAEPGDLQQLAALRQHVENLLRETAERQGLEASARGFRLTPRAYRTFQGKLLERIFSQLQASRSGRHQNVVVGEGAVELPATKAYEFGDSLTQVDIPQTLINAMLREGPGIPVRMKTEDIEIHHTRNRPRCATSVIMDMSGSMRHDGQYINVKRMALALDGLIRGEYPGDYLQFIEMYTFAKHRAPSEIIDLMPKPVTLFDPVVQLRADLSRDDLTESMIHPHFTNIQHSLQLARRLLATQDTPNRQIILITDGLPTAHFEDEWLYMLYPPHPRTEAATLREGRLCAREGITINLFLVPSWSQSEEDIRFARRLAETTRGRVFYTAGKDLDRYVVWDYVQRKREILG